MDNRFKRNIGALTEEECLILNSKKVFVAGCGGLGGYIIEYLTRLGIGEIIACDGDSFDETNLNRQLLSTEANLGKNKALAAKERAKSINSSINFTSVTEFVTEANAEALIKGCDVVVDALDNIEGRKVLSTFCNKLSIPMVHGAIDGWFAQVSVILPGSKTIDNLYGDENTETKKSTLSFVPAMCASLEVSEVVKLLLGKEGSLQGKTLFADLLENEYNIFDI